MAPGVLSFMSSIAVTRITAFLAFVRAGLASSFAVARQAFHSPASGSSASNVHNLVSRSASFAIGQCFLRGQWVSAPLNKCHQGRALRALDSRQAARPCGRR
jgi:hypothetical protein